MHPSRLPPPPHLVNVLLIKNKKGKERNSKSFKAETIKRLSPRFKYYCFSHSRACRIQKFFLSPNHGRRQYFSCFMASPLWNPIEILRPWWRNMKTSNILVIQCVTMNILLSQVILDLETEALIQFLQWPIVLRLSWLR